MLINIPIFKGKYGFFILNKKYLLVNLKSYGLYIKKHKSRNQLLFINGINISQGYIYFIYIKISFIW